MIFEPSGSQSAMAGVSGGGINYGALEAQISNNSSFGVQIQHNQVKAHAT